MILRVGVSSTSAWKLIRRRPSLSAKLGQSQPIFLTSSGTAAGIRKSAATLLSSISRILVTVTAPIFHLVIPSASSSLTTALAIAYNYEGSLVLQLRKNEGETE